MKREKLTELTQTILDDLQNETFNDGLILSSIGVLVASSKSEFGNVTENGEFNFDINAGL